MSISMLKLSELAESRKCYCVKCKRNTPYSIYDVSDLKGSFNNHKYTFAGKQARCVVCGKMVFPEEIQEYNNKQFDIAIMTQAGTENDNTL